MKNVRKKMKMKMWNTDNTYATLPTRWLLALCLLVSLPMSSHSFLGYTEDRPLVVACDWDFQPFEFVNSEGKPSGYNIDVLSQIFKRLDIPHKFVMQEWYLTTEMFEKQDADIIHALSTVYKGHPYVMTHRYINYYNLRLARKVTTPELHSIKSLTDGDTLILKNNDYAANCLKLMQDRRFTVEYHTPKEGLRGLRSGKYKYYIWGEVPLISKIKELDIDSLTLDQIDIPTGELRIIGYDKDLIDAIDDEYSRMEQEGELVKIYDKWFHPERIHDDSSPMSLIILITIAIAGLIAFLMSRLITLRVKNAMRKSMDLNNMMVQALEMGDYSVLEYDIETRRVRNTYGHLLPEKGLSINELISRIVPEQQEDFRKHIEDVENGTSDHWTLSKRWNAGTTELPDWRDLFGNAIVELQDGKPRYIVHTIKDITKEVAEERINEVLGLKYKKMFDENIVAMSFYDKDGHLINVNQKMIEICNLDEGGRKLFYQQSLYEFQMLKDVVKPRSKELIHACQHMKYPEAGIDRYIEFRIGPSQDEDGEVAYILITCRDITAEREMYRELGRHDQELQKTNKSIKLYEDQMHFLLEKSNMFAWQLDLDTKMITYTRTLRKTDYIQSLDNYLNRMYEDNLEEAHKNIEEKILKGMPFNAVHHFHSSPFANRPTWYSISGIPLPGKTGEKRTYFGIIRDITSLMKAQQKLKEETSRAEDSGRLKAAFLANMTHEIRTPLNAIVGFSDILQMVDTEEERMEFIRIIRNNCDMLLRLINDILEASTMGQALAVDPEMCDFSQVFDDICQTLEQRVAEAGVPFIKDNPYPTFPAILDKGRIQQVLTNFTTNAIKYTKEGHIKVGYREESAGITFYCEDTGAGIPKDKQAAVFERFVKLNDFVQGTGLGLSICKAIAERCNGKIGVSSEGEGKGSTFWMWIPQ